MKKNWMLCSGLIAALCMVGSAFAGDGDGCKGAATAAKSCSDKKECKELAGMPKLTYKVGDKTVCCPAEAKELAKGDEKAIKFVVADKSFDKQSEAMDALAVALAGYYDTVLTVNYAVGDKCVACPMTAEALAKKESKKVQFRLASYTYESKDIAENAAKSGREAGSKVTMKTMKDGKEVACVGGSAGCCAKSGAAKTGETAKAGETKSCPVGGSEAKAEKTGQTASAGQCSASGGKGEAVEYVIGDQKFNCEYMAKVEYQKARIAAAVKAIESANGHG